MSEWLTIIGPLYLLLSLSPIDRSCLGRAQQGVRGEPCSQGTNGIYKDGIDLFLFEIPEKPVSLEKWKVTPEMHKEELAEMRDKVASWQVVLFIVKWNGVRITNIS